MKPKYTKAQINKALRNNKPLKKCPKWMQKLFLETPFADLWLITGKQIDKSGWAGKWADAVYRISDRWAERIPKLENGRLISFCLLKKNCLWNGGGSSMCAHPKNVCSKKCSDSFCPIWKRCKCK